MRSASLPRRACGSHSLPARKAARREGGLRVPLIVDGPGLAKTRVVDSPLINTDWLPTLLELAGVRSSGEIDGISQAKLLESGRPSSGTRAFFWHIPHYTNQGSRPSGARRDGKWKLVERYDDGKVELFDSSADAGEARDLAAADPRRAASMRARLRQWRQSTGAQENTPNPGLDVDMFNRIYADFDLSRFDPLRAGDEAWKSVAVWRQRMNAATRRPPQ